MAASNLNDFKFAFEIITSFVSGDCSFVSAEVSELLVWVETIGIVVGVGVKSNIGSCVGTIVGSGVNSKVGSSVVSGVTIVGFSVSCGNNVVGVAGSTIETVAPEKLKFAWDSSGA